MAATMRPASALYTGPHKIGTVRSSCDTVDTPAHPRNQESLLCCKQPYSISPMRSRPRCSRRCAVPDMATSWRCICCCCVRPGTPRPRLQPSCSARAPVSIASRAPTVPARWTADEDGTLAIPVRTTVLMPSLHRLLGVLLKAPPRRLWLVPDARELRDAGRAVGRQAAPHGVRGDRAALAARTRLGLETGQADDQRYRSPTGRAVGPHPVSFRTPGGRDVLVFADELDFHLLPKVGYAWIPKGVRELVMTPGRSACPRAGQPTTPAPPPARPAIGS